VPAGQMRPGFIRWTLVVSAARKRNLGTKFDLNLS
jgi:hypothetical protein